MSECPECKEHDDHYGFILHALERQARSNLTIMLLQVGIYILFAVVAFGVFGCAAPAGADENTLRPSSPVVDRVMTSEEICRWCRATTVPRCSETHECEACGDCSIAKPKRKPRERHCFPYSTLKQEWFGGSKYTSVEWDGHTVLCVRGRLEKR